MPLRNARPLTMRASGVTDSADGSNAPDGSMSVLTDLVPAPGTARAFIPRVASEELTGFTGFTVPAGGTALLVIGTRAYGMISSDAFAGHDEPFCYDIAAGAFVTVTGATAGNTPATPALSGDWTPPTMVMVGTKIMITHPGYSGANKIGFIDLSGFTSSSLTGTTHTSTLIDTLSANPITSGWQVGMTVAGVGVVAGSRIVSLTAASITLDTATTSGGAGVALTVTGGTFAAPVYGAGNTNTNPLTAVAKAVGQMNGRAWYAVNNTVVFSDSLSPLQVTNASQALTLGDSTDVTAFGGLPLSNPVAGGVVQALICFKGAGTVFVIKGDIATMNLTLDVVAGAPGTLAPLSVCPTPLGLAYIAPDGLRVIDVNAQVGQPIGAAGTGVTEPFALALYPSRMAAAYNANVIRISVQNGGVQDQPQQEWWYSLSRQIWTGPHSFPAAMIQPYFGGGGNTFILFAIGVDAKLFQQSPEPTLASAYVENGTAMSWVWQTSLLPDNQEGAMNAMVETTLAAALPPTQQITVLALDEDQNTLDTLVLLGVATGGSVWGTLVWGSGVWGGNSAPLKQKQLPWSVPLVFKQMGMRMTGDSIPGLAIGNLYLKYQTLGYLIGAA